MTSNEIKAAFAVHGVKVRVRDLGTRFRVCGFALRSVYGEHTGETVAHLVASSLLCTDTGANLGGQWNGSQEFICYKPGAVVRS